MGRARLTGGAWRRSVLGLLGGSAVACADAPFERNNPWDAAVDVTITYSGFPDSALARGITFQPTASMEPAQPGTPVTIRLTAGGGVARIAATGERVWIDPTASPATIRFSIGAAGRQVEHEVFAQQQAVSLEAECADPCRTFTAFGQLQSGPTWRYRDAGNAPLVFPDTYGGWHPGALGSPPVTFAHPLVDVQSGDSSVVTFTGYNRNEWLSGFANGETWIRVGTLGLADSVRVVVAQQVAGSRVSCSLPMHQPSVVAVGDTIPLLADNFYDSEGHPFVGTPPVVTWRTDDDPYWTGQIQLLGDSAFVATAPGNALIIVSNVDAPYQDVGSCEVQITP